MEANVVNAMLYREIKSGKEFEKLIPAYLQIDMNFEKNNTLSDTYDTLQFMANWTVKYAHQFEKLAQRLKGKNVLETVQNNYSFLYNHFQYKIDESNLDQTLYSLSGAWHYRKNGFDCKTFSLLASGLLLAQGIPHSFRKIKIDSDDWAHVYVVVPINKNQYTIIDATTKDNKEVRFIEKHDFDMTKYLKHRGIASPIAAINALACPSTPSCGCKSSLGNPVMTFAYNGLDDMYGSVIRQSDITSNQRALNSSFNFDGLFKNFNFDKLFQSISCWGGTAFDANILKGLIPEILKYFVGIIEDYNKAISEKRFSDVHKIYVNYWLKRHALLLTYIEKKNSKDWNNCSDASFDFVISFLENKIYKVLGLAFEKHIITYFNLGGRTNSLNFTQLANLPDTFDGVYMWGTAIGRPVMADIHYYTTDVSPKTNEIPAFIVTTELQTAMNSDVKTSNFNTSQYLQTIQTVAPILVSILQPGTNNNYNSGEDIYADGSDPNKPKTNTGFSTNQKLIGGGLLAVGAWKLYKILS